MRRVFESAGHLEVAMGGQTAPDHADIHKTVDAYLEWSRTGDQTAFDRAFHPQASVVNASNGDDRVAVWTIQQFADGVEALRRAHGTVEESARSVSVDAARNVASVRVEFDLQIGEARNVGTDYLSLARVGDRWLITQKIYDSDRPYSGPPR